MSQRQAIRSVAGPAPPPSWRNTTAFAQSASGSEPCHSKSSTITEEQLQQASSLISNPSLQQSTRGVIRLVEHCLYTALRFLNDDHVIHLAQDQKEGRGCAAREVQGSVWTCGEVLREQTAYLESPLKAMLLQMSSTQPENSPLRLADASLRAILGSHVSVSNHRFSHTDEWDRSSANSEEGCETADTTLQYLPLTLHPSPQTFLRLLPSFLSLSLTSLNLAYSSLPVELEKLVTVLPPGLRELGLVGVRFTRERPGGSEDWRRGLGLLGRKLIVLRVCFLSICWLAELTVSLDA